MQSTSSAYQIMIKESSRHFLTKIKVGDSEYSDLRNFKLHTGIIGGDHITFGNTFSSYVEFEMDDIPYATFLQGKKAEVYIGLELDNSIEWLKMGAFFISKPIRDDMVIKIKAYDYFYKSEIAYFTDLKGKQKIGTILNELCKKIGISYGGGGDDAELYPIDKLTGLKIREAIGVLAAYSGKNAIIDRNEQLKLKWFSNTNQVITASRFTDPLDIDENNTLINSLKCALGDEKDTIISCGTGTGIEFSNTEMTETRLNTLLNRIKGFSYRACVLNLALGQPEFEAGDIITVEDKKGNQYIVPIMDMTIEVDGGCLCTITSKSKSEEEKEFKFKGTLTKKVEYQATQLAVFKEVITDKINAIEGNFETINTNYLNVNGKLTALEGQFNDLKSTTVTTTYLESNYAKIDLTNIKDGSITTAMIGTGVVGNAQIADGSITDAKIVTLTANKINAGTLSVERLVISGSDKSIVYAINNAGDLVSTSVDTIDGNVLTPRTITADKVVAESITGNEIASRTITANKLVANSITSAEISAGAITTSELASGAVTAAKIAAGTITATQIASNTITSDKIATGAITIGKLDSSTQSTINGAAQKIYHTTTGTSGASGYFLLAQFKITGVYVNQPIKISIINRGRLPSSVWINFANANSTDPGISTLKKSGTANFYMAKATTSTWNLYVQKSEAYDNLSVTEFELGAHNKSRMTITWQSSQVSALPSGYTTATQLAASAEWCYNNDITYINGGKIYTGTVTAVQIAAKAITADKLNVTSLSAISANLGTVTAGTIKGTTISAATISGGTITGTAIKGGSITSGTTINVSTNLTVGNNVYLGSGDVARTIYFNSTNSYIQRVSYKSGDYLSVRASMRTALVTGSALVWTYYYNSIYQAGLEAGTSKIIAYSDGTTLISSSAYSTISSTSGGIKLVSGDSILYLEGNGIGSGRCFRPQGANNNQIKLGDTSAGWYRLYASLSNYTTSDIRKKTNIKEYDSRFESMYMDLKPITYELISDRGQSHCGFIAQWTKEAMLKNKILDSEFGVYIHENDEYGMAYEEMVSLNTHMIQKTILRVNKHDEEISKLKDEIKQLQAKLNAYENGTMEVRIWQA